MKTGSLTSPVDIHHSHKDEVAFSLLNPQAVNALLRKALGLSLKAGTPQRELMRNRLSC